MNNISRRNFALLELWHIKQPQTLKTPTIGDTLSSNEITSEKKKKTKTINTLPPSPPFKVRIFFVLLYSTFTCSSNSSTAMNGEGGRGGGGRYGRGSFIFLLLGWQNVREAQLILWLIVDTTEGKRKEIYPKTK